MCWHSPPSCGASPGRAPRRSPVLRAAPAGLLRRATRVAAPKELLFFLSVLRGRAVWRCTLFTRLGHRHHHGVPTDDTPHPVPPIVSCIAVSRNLFLPHTVLLDMPPPQRRRFHTQWARNNTQSLCSGCPGTGRSTSDVSARSGSFLTVVHSSFAPMPRAITKLGTNHAGW